MYKKVDKSLYDKAMDILNALPFSTTDELTFTTVENGEYSVWLPSKKTYQTTRSWYTEYCGINHLDADDISDFCRTDIWDDVVILIADWTHYQIITDTVTKIKDEYIKFLRNTLNYIVLVGNIIYEEE